MATWKRVSGAMYWDDDIGLYGVYRENGKENGSYYLGLRRKSPGKGFRVWGFGLAD